MTTKIEDLTVDVKYLIFQALSHPYRVRILMSIEANDLTFGSLKHEMGMESSGQLQHHLQKLSGLIKEKDNGSYCLTDAGIRALEVFRESERSGRPLKDLCSLPAPNEMAQYKEVNGIGSLLRLSLGLILTALTIGIIVVYAATGQMALTFKLSSSAFVSFGVTAAILFGFFGISYLISAFTRYPGCEITAIPNLFTRQKRYCSCMLTPFNLPKGGLIQGKARVSP